MLAMRRRDVVLGGLALAGSAAIPRRASASPLASFEIAPLADPCWCFSGFPSTAQHVARNSNGTFYAVALGTNDPVNFASTNFAIFRDAGGGPVLWWSGTLPTNMLCLEAFAAGDLLAIYSDFTAGKIVVLAFASPSTGAVPSISTLSGAGCLNLKIGTCLDDARRCIYLLGSAGYFFRISATGVEGTRQQVVSVAGQSWPVYWSLSLDENGRLFAVVSTSTTTSVPAGLTEYDAVTAIMCVDPSDPAPVWCAGSWNLSPPAAPPLALPIDPSVNGPGAFLVWGEQARNNSNLLLSAAVANGALHAAIAISPGFAEQFMGFDDLRDCSLELTSAAWTYPYPFQNAKSHRPARGATIYPRCGSGALLARSCGLYFVGADRNNLVALRSTDWGNSWHDYASTPVVGLGADMIMYVAAARGQLDDSDIVGSFDVIHCTPSQRANSLAPVPPALAPNNPLATAYHFSLAA